MSQNSLLASQFTGTKFNQSASKSRSSIVSLYSNDTLLRMSGFNSGQTDNKVKTEKPCCQTKGKSNVLLNNMGGSPIKLEADNKPCCGKGKEHSQQEENSAKPQSSKSCSSGSCSCGGACGGNEEKKTKNLPTKKSKYSDQELFEMIYSFAELKSDNYTLRNNRILKSESAKITIPNTDVSYNVISHKYTNNVVNSKVIENKTGRELINIYIDKEQQFAISSNYNIPEFYKITEDLNAVNVAISSLWVSRFILAQKRIKGSGLLNEDKDNNDSKRKDKENKIMSEEGTCITHDMTCSILEIFTGDAFKTGKFELWFPCAGSFTVDVLDCCVKHDINLWCTEGAWKSAEIDLEVVNCILAKIAKKAWDNMWFVCIGIAYPLFLLLMIEPYRIAATYMPTFTFYRDNLRNINGVNNESCLCGGNKKTVCCNWDNQFKDTCFDENCNLVNLCESKKENNYRKGAKCNTSAQPCINCRFDCITDFEGNVISKQQITVLDKSKYQKCCNDDCNYQSTCANCKLNCIYHDGKLIPKEKRIAGNRFHKCCDYNLKDNCPEKDPNANNDPDSTWCRYNRNDPRCKIKLDDDKQVGRME